MLLVVSAAAQTIDHGRINHSPSDDHAMADANERLGAVSFPVSCAPASQGPFNRGIALLHDFWYEEARAQFTRLVASDSACAMAHWGLAMSGFHQIWDRPDADGMKLGWAEMQKAQAHPAGTGRERAYISALADFYRPGATQYPERIAKYSAAMRRLFDEHPEDVDAGAFYALSLLAAEATDDTSLSQQRKAMAVLKPLFMKYRDNPGVVHYIIHACDNPEMAADGLAAANHYGEIAQSGAHAFHMPGHIYARLGMWTADVTAQLGSIAASEMAEARGESGLMDELHSYDFLLYACLQSGRDLCAGSALKQVETPLEKIASMPGMGASFMVGMVPYYRKKLPAFYALERRDWKSAAALEQESGAPPESSDVVYWARVIGHGRLRQAKEAQEDMARYDELVAEIKKGPRGYLADGTFPKIERHEMLAWVAFARGDEAEALKSMRAAADLQDKVGQAEVDIPAREMLADMLLEFQKPQQAMAEYEAALKLSPNRLNGLFNAGRAAELAGDTTRAKRYYATLLKSTHNGEDSGRSEMAHARSFLNAQ